MFKCQICGRSSRNRYSIIRKGRRVSYTSIIVNPKKDDKKINSKGWEIIEELFLCFDCYKKHKSDQIQMISSNLHRVNIQKQKLKKRQK